MATPVVGTVTGIVLCAMAPGLMIELLDEEGCVWFWVNISFLDWLIDNAWWLGPLCIACPLLAAEEIMLAFLVLGYFRLGSATIWDAAGTGTPSAPNPPDPAEYSLSISVPFGHGTTNPSPGTYTYTEGTSVTVTAIPDEYCGFSYWKLDDGWSTDNPITITMDCDHTLRCQFVQEGSGGPPGGGGGNPLGGTPER